MSLPWWVFFKIRSGANGFEEARAGSPPGHPDRPGRCPSLSGEGRGRDSLGRSSGFLSRGSPQNAGSVFVLFPTAPLNTMPFPREQLEIPVLIFPPLRLRPGRRRPPAGLGAGTMMSSRAALPGMSSWGGAGPVACLCSSSVLRLPLLATFPPSPCHRPPPPPATPATAAGGRRCPGNDGREQRNQSPAKCSRVGRRKRGSPCVSVVFVSVET